VSKNVAVFVDVANIFYAAKAAGVDIDYVTLLKSATAGRDLVRAYAYTGLDPDNENQRNFHSFLARNGYRVVSKDIRKYGDGKVKANLDIELVVDMMKTARNLDIAIVVSGDGDFAPAIRAVQETGVRVEVISFRGNTSSDLMEVADQFTDITALARVEKGSSRSGRRVAGDHEDLSMTEVPDKQTEGVGGRGRTRGRGRGRGTAEVEPIAASASGRSRGTSSASAGAMVALPGEKLSRLGDEVEAVDVPETDGRSADGEDAADGEAPRRRRRRGGRGRGRGRGREETTLGEAVPVDDKELPEVPPVRTPQPTPFGSVWESQIGTPRPAAPGSPLPPLDEEDLDEPAIPEYLIAEQRRNRGAGPGRGPARGGRSSYTAAIERERYGRGGGGGGINRYPDVSGRDRDRGRGESFPRRDRPAPVARSGGGAEPWSEVPPELEAMLRAQLASKPRSQDQPVGDRGRASTDESNEPASATGPAAIAEDAPRTGRGRGRRAPTGAAAVTLDDTAPGATGVGAVDTEAPGPKRRTTRRTAAAADAPEPTAAADVPEGEPAPKRRAPRRSSAQSEVSPSTPEDAAPEAPAPRRRTAARRTTTVGASAAESGAAEPATAEPEATTPKRRAPRRKADATEGESA